MNEKEQLKEAIKDLHQKNGISYTFISKKIGISKSFLAMWLKGDRNISQNTLEKILKAYGGFIIYDEN